MLPVTGLAGLALFRAAIGPRGSQLHVFGNETLLAELGHFFVVLVHNSEVPTWLPLSIRIARYSYLPFAMEKIHSSILKCIANLV